MFWEPPRRRWRHTFFSPQRIVHSPQLRSSCFGNHPAAVGDAPFSVHSA
ncbi:MAG: hypothetical protein LBL66_05880 [Clostridiales bacterium]|nr:hypothetical protein [Clostridiales bacterium]